MSDTKQHFYKTLNAIVGTHRIDNEEAYIINDYISRLEATIKDEQEQLNKQKEVLDKIKEYITSYESINTIQECEMPEKNIGLDKGTFIEMVNRYMKVHDKLLELLEEIE